MKIEQLEEIQSLLTFRKIDIDIENYIYVDLETEIYNERGFEVDVIYHSSALEFLSEYDPSLMLSMNLADELGFSLKNINSELLASLLASNILRNEFNKLEKQITYILEMD